VQIDPQRERIGDAITAAERGQFDATQYADLASHPLYGWVEYAAISRDLDNLPRARAEAFLKQHRGSAIAEVFRAAWVPASDRRDDPGAVLAGWADSIKNTRLRCMWLDARHKLGRADAEWTREAQTLWTSSGASLPDACDPVFAALDSSGNLPPALRWQRLELAAAEWQSGVMRSIAGGLPAADRTLAEDYAAFIDNPHPRALQWPKTDRSRLIASQG